MKKSKKIIALSLTSVLACGLFAGCDSFSTDTLKNMEQIVAEVNIGEGESFQEGGEYAAYAGSIQTSYVYKRDLISQYLSNGSQMSNYSAKDLFTMIRESLVNRKTIAQYAMAYFLKNGATEESEDGTSVNRSYSVQEYNDYLAASKDKELASYEYFLSQTERDRAKYSVRKMVNNTLDSQEKNLVEEEEEKSNSSVSVRTLPTGVDGENSDYYDKDYKIYTGKNPELNYGSYEKIEGGKPMTRKRAYSSLLSNLLSNGLIEKGENVTDFESLDYFTMELTTAYENALINKLSEAFEREEEERLSREGEIEARFDQLFETQSSTFVDGSTFETTFGEMSASKFVLSAPNAGYGYVINILLPFDSSASEQLNNYSGLEGDKFVYRAQLLKRLTAIDQRETWFTGETDYSYDADENAFGGIDRNKLFFEDNMTAVDGGKYELLENYYGKYTYNGKAEYNEEKDTYKFTPNKIDIDDFIDEMESYLQFAGLNVSDNKVDNRSGYYDKAKTDYYDKNNPDTVDYSSFLYYKGKVEIANFDNNMIYCAGSDENKAMSVINELSFAYNTDTAGLNKYLGYAVSPYKTDFVKEFEFAAQEAVRGGAGTYTIAPSQYGWHIMYCTFAVTEAKTPLFTYHAEDKDKEGTFSNQYYESLKASAIQNRSKDIQTQIVNNYAACVTVYDDRCEDLFNLKLS